MVSQLPSLVRTSTVSPSVCAVEVQKTVPGVLRAYPPLRIHALLIRWARVCLARTILHRTFSSCCSVVVRGNLATCDALDLHDAPRAAPPAVDSDYSLPERRSRSVALAVIAPACSSASTVSTSVLDTVRRICVATHRRYFPDVEASARDLALRIVVPALWCREYSDGPMFEPRRLFIVYQSVYE